MEHTKKAAAAIPIPIERKDIVRPYVLLLASFVEAWGEEVGGRVFWRRWDYRTRECRECRTGRIYGGDSR